MYTYTWYQWLSFFYLYCFFGWIFESTYVSLKQRHFVNRGFLRSPMLPLYGTGAVMMLWVSLPVKDNLIAVYFSGAIAATLLEYVTGWCMERLFKVKYWDYSNQHFQFHGYICLSSSIAWGFLTLFLTKIIHGPIEKIILTTSPWILLVIDAVVSIVFVTDAVVSIRAALDLAKLLENIASLRRDLEEAQVQLALLKAEASQRVDSMKDETKNRVEQLRLDLHTEVASRISDFRDEKEDIKLRISELHTEQRSALTERIQNTTERMQSLTERHLNLISHMDVLKKSLLRGNPSASSRFSEALKELQEELYKIDKKHGNKH